MNDSRLREKTSLLAKSLYDRGLSHGTTGNISVRCADGGLIVTPTNSSLGFLDPAALSRFDKDGNHVDGPAPTKELALHTAFYQTRGTKAGAVVHLHSHYSIALSMMPDVDEDDMLPPLTPYPIMKLGRVKLLPYFRPGDPAMAEAVRNLGGARSAVVLANHGPVVASNNIDTAVFAIEELEAAARLTLEMRGASPRMLTREQASVLTATFGE